MDFSKRVVQAGYLVLVASVLSACSPEDKTKNFCSEETVSAHNNILIEGISVKYGAKSSKKLNENCQALKAQLGGGSCEAQKVSTGEKVSISYSSVQEACEIPVSGSKGAPGTGIEFKALEIPENSNKVEVSEAVSDFDVASYDRRFDMTIIDASAVQDLLDNSMTKDVAFGHVNDIGLNSSVGRCSMGSLNGEKVSVAKNEILNFELHEARTTGRLIGAGDHAEVVITYHSKSKGIYVKCTDEDRFVSPLFVGTKFSGIAGISNY